MTNIILITILAVNASLIGRRAYRRVRMEADRRQWMRERRRQNNKAMREFLRNDMGRLAK